jgi:hypothetical protein
LRTLILDLALTISLSVQSSQSIGTFLFLVFTSSKASNYLLECFIAQDFNCGAIDLKGFIECKNSSSDIFSFSMRLLASRMSFASWINSLMTCAASTVPF